MPIDRQKKLTIMVSDDELAALKRLADASGVPASAWVRAQIRQADAALEPKPKKGKK